MQRIAFGILLFLVLLSLGLPHEQKPSFVYQEEPIPSEDRSLVGRRQESFELRRGGVEDGSSSNEVVRQVNSREGLSFENPQQEDPRLEPFRLEKGGVSSQISTDFEETETFDESGEMSGIEFSEWTTFRLESIDPEDKKLRISIFWIDDYGILRGGKNTETLRDHSPLLRAVWACPNDEFSRADIIVVFEALDALDNVRFRSVQNLALK